MGRRTFTAFALTSVLPVHAIGQEASVAELTREESAKASELYKRLKSAEAEWLEFKNAIVEKYGPLVSKYLPRGRRTSNTKPDGTQFLVPEEWIIDGVEFSTDFRFVTAKPKRR